MRSLADNASKILGQPGDRGNKPGAGMAHSRTAVANLQPMAYTVAQIRWACSACPTPPRSTGTRSKDISYVLNVTGYAFGLVVPAD